MPNTRELIKKEIDKLPEATVKEIYRLIQSLPKAHKGKKRIRTFKLGGKFDDVNIRELAYE